MLRLANLPLMLGLLVWAPLVVAQSTLGELLDTGAKPLSPEEFKDQLVQRTIVGPSPTGGTLEVMYASNGMVQGVGTHPYTPSLKVGYGVNGTWTVDGKGRICTSMRIGGGGGGGGPALVIPPRCQFWFKLDSKYFFADSDTDRSAKVLVRTLKQ